MNFDMSVFLAPLDLLMLVAALMLGLIFGTTVTRAGFHHVPKGHLLWSGSAGVVFFIPLSILRAFEGSDTWERFLASLVLWILFVIGMSIPTLLVQRSPRDPHPDDPGGQPGEPGEGSGVEVDDPPAAAGAPVGQDDPDAAAADTADVHGPVAPMGPESGPEGRTGSGPI